jgi:hypothetical protein
MPTPTSDFSPSVNGLLRCLSLLAQEAATLKLLRTLSAIEEAMDTAACESGLASGDGGIDDDSQQTILH